MLEEKSKVLKCLVDKVTILRDSECLRTKLVGCGKNRFRSYKSVKTAYPILSELTNVEKKLKTENLRNSAKETLCNQVEQLVGKLDEIYAESIRMIKQE